MALKNASNIKYRISNKLPLFSYPCDFLSFFLGKIVFQSGVVGTGRSNIHIAVIFASIINLVCDITTVNNLFLLAQVYNWICVSLVINIWLIYVFFFFF